MKQLAKHGEAFAPPGLLHSITEARAHIRALKINLRQLGVDVEGLALDEGLNQHVPIEPSLHQVSPQASIYKSLWSMIEELHILVRIQISINKLLTKRAGAQYIHDQKFS